MPYFERQPTMPSVMKELDWRLSSLERTAQEGGTQTTVLLPNFEAGGTRALNSDGVVMNNISSAASHTMTLLSTDVTTSDYGFIEVYARVNADALVSGGSGRSMVMRIDVDGVSQGSYLSWTDQALTEKKTIQGSTVGTAATPAGGFVVVDDALPNLGWNGDDVTGAEADTVYTGLVLNGGNHTIDFKMVTTGAGTFGSVYKAVISIRTS